MAEIGATLTMVASFRFANDYWGAEGLGEWVLSRRVLAFLLPLLTFGLDVSLPRFIAQERSSGGGRHLLGGALMVFALVVLVLPVLMVFRETVAAILFGGREYASLVLPVCVLCAGYAFYITVYGYLRGKMMIMGANLAHIVAYGVLPLVVLLLFHPSSAQTIAVIGAICLLVSIVFLMAVVSRRGSAGFTGVTAVTGELVRYGRARMTAAFLLMSILLVPASVAAGKAGIEAGGYVGFAMSVVGLAASAFAPIGVILLPMAASMAADRRYPELWQRFVSIQKYILGFAIVAMTAIIVAAPLISLFIVGAIEDDLVLALRIAGLAAGPFVYFTFARPVIDACSERGINAINLAVALGAFLLVLLSLTFYGTGAIQAVMWSYVAGMIVLGVLSGISIFVVLATRR